MLQYDLLIGLLLSVSCIGYHVPLSRNPLKISILSQSLQRLNFAGNDVDREGSLNNLKVDFDQLSEAERKRIDLIQKITLEADEMVRAAGFVDELSDIERGVFVEAKDTQWTGQSNVEISRRSENNIFDLIYRWDLAMGDILGDVYPNRLIYRS